MYRLQKTTYMKYILLSWKKQPPLESIKTYSPTFTPPSNGERPHPTRRCRPISVPTFGRFFEFWRNHGIFLITMDLKKLSSMMRKDCKGSGSAGVKRTWPNAFQLLQKYVHRKRPLGCQIWSRWQESATFNLPPSGSFTSKGQVRRLPPQMSRISDYAWLSAEWILNQIVFVPGKFWEALPFNMDENHLSSLPLGGKNRQLSAWICTTCHAGVAWVLTAGCRGHIILLLSIFDQRFPTAANQPAADRMLSLHMTLGDKFWASTKTLSKHRNKCQEILVLKYLYDIYMPLSTYIYCSSELMQHHGLIYWKIHGNSSTSGVTALFSSVTSKSWPPGTSSTFSQQGRGGWNIIQTSWEYPPPKRKALLRDSWGIMVVNSPLLMPYLWEVAFRRVYLRFPRK